MPPGERIAAMDLLLAIILGLLQLLLGGLGVYVSLRPPKRERHWWWIGSFFAIGVLGAGLVGLQAKRSVDAQADLQKQINNLPTRIPKPPTARENAQALLALEKQQNSKEAPAAPSGRPKSPVRPQATPERPAAPQFPGQLVLLGRRLRT